MQLKIGFGLNKILLAFLFSCTKCTIDINMSEFQYLADHLHAYECRKLVAGLHFQSFDTPNALNQAETQVSKDVSCLQQLLHWNREKDGGKSESHELVSRRLNQIGREDLARWLTKSSYEALGHDFERRARDSFKLYEPIHLPEKNLSGTVRPTRSTMPTRITMSTTNKYAYRRIIKQDVAPPVAMEVTSDPTEWTIFDTISWTMVTVLFLIIIVLMVYLTIASPCIRDKKKSNKHSRDYNIVHDEDDYYDSPYISPMYRQSSVHTQAKPAGRHSASAVRSSPITVAHQTQQRNQMPRNCCSKAIQEESFEIEKNLKEVCLQTSFPTVAWNQGAKVKTFPRVQHSSAGKPDTTYMLQTTLSSEENCIGCNTNRRDPTRAALDLMGVEMPRAHKRSGPYSHENAARRTIDIHQKIAIPISPTGT